jgi:hypothetical protein
MISGRISAIALDSKKSVDFLKQEWHPFHDREGIIMYIQK